MIRNQLLDLLHSYNPHAPEEVRYKKDMIDFINANPRCFERTLAIGHITGSAWLLNRDGSKALLMHHAKLGKWFQLGGHCDGDSDVMKVAIKEAQEESGIQNIVALSPAIFDIDIHLIPANSREVEHYHYDVRFLLQVVGDEEVQQNNESKALVWIGKDRQELPTDSRSVVRMFDKWVTLNLL